MARKPLIASLLLIACLLTSLAFTSAQARLPFAEQSLAPMLEQTMPAVVSVRAYSPQNSAGTRLLDDPFFQQFFNIPRTPPKNRPNSAGSGVIIDAKKGHIITNHHVIAGAQEIRVTLHDNREFVAKLLGSDEASDIALIQIAAGSLRDLPLGDSDALRIGDFVVAIGNPFGIGQSATSGIVSALGRNSLGIEGYEDFIQTDASINPGNSGGALVDLKGRLVGINTAIYAPSGGNVGIGFAIPINMVQRLAKQLITYGNVQRGLLGVATQDLSPDLADAMGLNGKQGAVINRVLDYSPAKEVGLLEGDVITHIDQRPVSSSTELRNAIGLKRVGEKARIAFIRDQKTQSVLATITDPDDAQPPGIKLARKFSGAQFIDITLNAISGRRGAVLITNVDRKSPAWKLGLRESDILLSLNGNATRDLSNLRQLIQDAQGPVRLVLRRSGREIKLIIK